MFNYSVYCVFVTEKVDCTILCMIQQKYLRNTLFHIDTEIGKVLEFYSALVLCGNNIMQVFVNVVQYIRESYIIPY